MIPNQIGLFERYTKIPNTIEYGYLYIHELETNLPLEKKRTVRVFLPDDYFTNTNKKYSVMYMSDGQNMVDKYTTAYGEWDVDVRNHEMMEEGYDGLIYVGFDSPSDYYARMAEMIPTCMTLNNKKYKMDKNYQICGEVYLDYIFNVIKPIIDQTFRTNPERENTLFGGSSMGGLISFYAGFYRQDVVSKTLCFSPAFLLSNNRLFLKMIDELIDKYGNNVKMSFLSGGKELDSEILYPTYKVYNHLFKRGFTIDQVHLVIDSKGIHNESFWSKYFKNAVEFLLEEKNE